MFIGICEFTVLQIGHLIIRPLGLMHIAHHWQLSQSSSMILGNLSPVIFCCFVLISSWGMMRLSGETSHSPFSLDSLTLNSGSPVLSDGKELLVAELGENKIHKINKLWLFFSMLSS